MVSDKARRRKHFLFEMVHIVILYEYILYETGQIKLIHRKWEEIVHNKPSRPFQPAYKLKLCWGDWYVCRLGKRQLPAQHIFY